ncbi:hypothetical protein B0H14DRAFT_2571136 [Mycena olivaceomarginata]|nr:hypothetical protein B0H14DRAFT_2571136 [Mycena olivaceomarginata]
METASAPCQVLSSLFMALYLPALLVYTTIGVIKTIVLGPASRSSSLDLPDHRPSPALPQDIRTPPFKFTQLLLACQTACCTTAPLLHPHHPATCRACSPRLGGSKSAALDPAVTAMAGCALPAMTTGTYATTPPPPQRMSSPSARPPSQQVRVFSNQCLPGHLRGLPTHCRPARIPPLLALPIQALQAGNDWVPQPPATPGADPFPYLILFVAVT